MRDEEKEVAYTYMVECGDGSLYTGWTNDLVKRMRNHNAGKGAKYTKARLPVRLVYYEKYLTKQEAMRREYDIKQMHRRDKLSLLATASANLVTSCNEIMERAKTYG